MPQFIHSVSEINTFLFTFIRVQAGNDSALLVMLYFTSNIIWHVQPSNPWWWLGGWSSGPDWSCWREQCSQSPALTWILTALSTKSKKASLSGFLHFNLWCFVKRCSSVRSCYCLHLHCNPVSEVLHLGVWLVFHWKEADVLISYINDALQGASGTCDGLWVCILISKPTVSHLLISLSLHSQ